MKVMISPRSGFCFGVKRAVNIAEQALKEKRAINSLGPLIHNKCVVGELSKKGLRVVKTLKGLKPDTRLIIPSHGIRPEVKEKVKNLELKDATCPFVRNCQTLASRLGQERYSVVIVGDKLHPEVCSIVGFSRGRGRVVKDAYGIGRLALGPKVAVISQTTQSSDNFKTVAQGLCRKGHLRELRIFNTICSDTSIRQKAASRLAKKSGIMLIIGDRESANTRRLYEICKGITPSYHVETEKDLRARWFKDAAASSSANFTVGIATGASTPDWVVQRVVKRIKLLGI